MGRADQMSGCFKEKGTDVPLIFDGKGSLNQFAERLMGVVDENYGV